MMVMDFVIGLGYLQVGPLTASYSVPQRLQDLLTSSWVSTVRAVAADARADFYHLLISALGTFTLVVTVYVFPRSARPRAWLAPPDATGIRDLLDSRGDRDSLGYFALRDDKCVIWSPSARRRCATACSPG
jgi:lysyl-tRNA synthetase class 2